MRRHCQFTVKRSPKCAVSDQPQRPPSQHDSTTVWHLGQSRCARTKIGASVVSQYGQRGGSALAGLSSVALSVGTFYHWQCYPDFLEVIFDIFLFSRPAKKRQPNANAHPWYASLSGKSNIHVVKAMPPNPNNRYILNICLAPASFFSSSSVIKTQ